MTCITNKNNKRWYKLSEVMQMESFEVFSKIYFLNFLQTAFQQIKTLVALPCEDFSRVMRCRKEKEQLEYSCTENKSMLGSHPYYKRPGYGHNRDCCDACSEGGDIICCDKCPASF